MPPDLNQASDEELLDAYFVGEASAFATFFRRHQGRVQAYAQNKGLNPEVAREVTQDAFLKLHRFIHSYEKGRPALPWFFTIVHHAVLDGARGVKIVPAALVRDLKAVDSNWTLDKGANEGERDSSLVARALSSLKPNEQELMRLRVIEELSFREIALQTGKTDTSLRKLFERTKQRLERKMKTRGRL